MRMSLSIVLFAVISSAFGGVLNREDVYLYEHLAEVTARYDRTGLKAAPITVEEELNSKTFLPVTGSAEPTIEPESEGFESIGTKTILENETQKLRKNEFSSEEIPAESFKIDSRDITSKQNRNKRGIGASSFPSVSRVLLTEVGKKVTSATGDEMINRLNPSINQPPTGYILGGAAAGAAIGGTLGSAFPGVGTAIGAAVGTVVGSGVIVLGNRIVNY